MLKVNQHTAAPCLRGDGPQSEWYQVQYWQITKPPLDLQFFQGTYVYPNSHTSLENKKADWNTETREQRFISWSRDSVMVARKRTVQSFSSDGS